MRTWSLRAKSCQNMAMYAELICISKDSHIFQKVLSTLYTRDNIYDTTFLSYLLFMKQPWHTIFWHFTDQNQYSFLTIHNTALMLNLTRTPRFKHWNMRFCNIVACTKVDKSNILPTHQPWRWSQQVCPKHCYLHIRWHSIPSLKTVILMVHVLFSNDHAIIPCQFVTIFNSVYQHHVIIVNRWWAVCCLVHKPVLKRPKFTFSPNVITNTKIPKTIKK